MLEIVQFEAERRSRRIARPLSGLAARAGSPSSQKRTGACCLWGTAGGARDRRLARGSDRGEVVPGEAGSGGGKLYPGPMRGIRTRQNDVLSDSLIVFSFPNADLLARSMAQPIDGAAGSAFETGSALGRARFESKG